MRSAEPAPSGFYAPEPYSAQWSWIGLALLIVVAAWYGWIWWCSTRPPGVGIPPRITPDRLTRIRADYIQQIDLVVAQTHSGQLSQRRAHQQVSVLVRHFVQEVSGIRAPTMTLTDLNSSGDRLGTVSHVVGILYPGEFDPKDTATVAGAATVAKEVVARWS